MVPPSGGRELATLKCDMPDASTERLVNDFPDVTEAYINDDAGEDIVGVEESFFFCCRIHAGSTSRGTQRI